MRAGRLRCGRSGRRGWQRTRLLPGQQAGPAAAHAPVALRRHRIFHRLFHLQVTPAGPAAPSLPDVRITNDRTAQMTTSPARYEIRVEGVLGEDWSAWFDGLQVASDSSGTVISGVIPDQPALHGLLNRVRDLGLYLIS